MRRILLISMAGLLVLPLGCSLVPLGGNDDITINNVNPMDLTPRENEEAELMALWLSGELVAPTALYDSIVTELALIRSQWADSLAFWDDSLEGFGTGLTFTPPWRPGQLSISAKPSLLDSVLNGNHIGFNSILINYRAHISPRSYELAGKTRFSMISSEHLNPYVMREEVQSIDGVISTSWGPFAGSTPNIYRLVTTGRGVLYFWDHAWGDCPSGCIFSHVFYFLIKENLVTLVDSHTYAFDSPRPEWSDTLVALSTNWGRSIPQSDFAL